MKKIYTQEQLAEVVKLHDGGMSFPHIAEELNRKYKFGKSGDAMRAAYRRATKAEQKVRKKTRPAKKLLPKFEDINRRVDTRNDRILFISDMHIPFHHPDTFAFLTALKKKYKPTRVVCVGDEIDAQSLSFHDSDPDLPSAGDELQKAIKYLQVLYKTFPVVDIVDSNHGSMIYRKGKHHGIPRKYLRDYGEVLEAPKGWIWSHDLTIALPDGNDLYVHHSVSKNVLKVVNQRGTCYIHGHHHCDATIQYSGNPRNLLWGMAVGCSINKKALAFAYDKNNLARPIISHGMVIDSHPRLMPMVLNEDGRWNGFVP